MFVRRKVNRSGSISVHVVDKSRGGFKVIKTFGTASTAYEADLLEDKARQYIREQTGQLESLFGDPGEDRLNEFIAGLHNAQIQVAGPELIFGALPCTTGSGITQLTMNFSATWSSVACSIPAASCGQLITCSAILESDMTLHRYIAFWISYAFLN